MYFKYFQKLGFKYILMSLIISSLIEIIFSGSLYIYNIFYNTISYSIILFSFSIPSIFIYRRINSLYFLLYSVTIISALTYNAIYNASSISLTWKVHGYYLFLSGDITSAGLISQILSHSLYVFSSIYIMKKEMQRFNLIEEQ